MFQDHVKKTAARCCGHVVINSHLWRELHGEERAAFRAVPGNELGVAQVRVDLEVSVPLFVTVSPTGQTVYVWSTSPEVYGISWEIGTADTPEEAAAALFRAWRTNWSVCKDRAEFVPGDDLSYDRYAGATWYSRPARESFGQALGASGGVALLAARHSSAADAALGRGGIYARPDLMPPANWATAEPVEWELTGFSARRPE